MAVVTRAQDELVLDCLGLLRLGVTPKTIAARFGLSPSFVSVQRQRVMRDDIVASELPAAEILAAYHPPKKPKKMRK